MSTDVVLRSTDVPSAFAEQMHMARVLSESSLLPGHLRGKPANVLVILGGARALDVSSFWALQSMHVVDGKLSMAAELMRALVIRAGHKISIVERSDKRAVVEIQRSDKTKPYRAEFTWEEAVRAKLVNKDNWRHYPAAMLVARATSIAVRDECPDVMFGVVYTPDELGAVVDEDGQPRIGEDGAVIIDGSVVEPVTAETISDWVDSMAGDDLHQLSTIVVEATERGALDEKAADGATVREHAAFWVALGAPRCRSKIEVRELWKFARDLDLLGAQMKDRGGKIVTLKEVLQGFAEGLPEEAPTEPVAEAELVEEDKPVVVDTEHAQAMREAAAATWEGEVVDEQPVATS